MADVIGTVVMIKMKIRYSNGDEKLITIPEQEAKQIGALIFDESVYDKTVQKQYDNAIKQSFAETVKINGSPSLSTDSTNAATGKHTMLIVYRDDEVKAACSNGSHPPHWF